MLLCNADTHGQASLVGWRVVPPVTWLEVRRVTLSWRSGLSEGPRGGIGSLGLVLADRFTKGRDLVGPCKQPADPSPASMCTLLEIEHHVKREEEVDGESRMYRLAVGDRTQLEAVSRPDLQFERVFCDGSRGRRKRVPTLLEPQRGARSYKCAVWLDQIESTVWCSIECSMVRAKDNSGRRFYAPTSKSSTKG
jgi:hypothetical protein